jgi:hypothetical protein
VADITIESAVNAQVSYRADRLGPIWTSASVGYVFLEDTTRLLLQYRKTTDGGATWGSPVTVITDSSRMLRISVWFDKWTPGDSGTLIHCYAYNWGVDAWRYRSLDTATDTLGTEVTASPAEDDAGATNNLASMTHSTTKSRNGNLYIAYQHGTGGGWRRSTDGGATWTGRASPFESGAIDIVAAVPANTGDDADAALIFWDASADALSVKMYDNSADTWTETAIASSMVENADVYLLSASVRHSDGHAIVAAWSALDTTTADLLVWDLTLDSIASPTVTALTNVLTDAAEAGCAAVQIDQNTDDIYVAYLRGGTWGSSLDAYYKVSTDGGTTWGSETALSETTDDHRGIWTDLSTAYGTAGRFSPVWKNDDLFDLVTNAGNSVELTAASGGGSEAAAGATAGVSAVSGTLSATVPVAAASAGISTVGGTASATVRVAAPIAVTTTVSGSLTVAAGVAGASAGTSAAAGTLSAAVPVASGSVGTSTASGALSATVPAVGATDGVSTAAGAASSTVLIAAASDGVSDASGTLSSQGQELAAGLAAGVSSVSGTLSAAVAVSGAVTGLSTAGGTTSATVPLSGAAAGVSTASADLSEEAGGSQEAVAGAAASVSAVSGTLSGAVPIAASTAGMSALVAMLRAAVVIAGAATGTSTASGTMDGSIKAIRATATDAAYSGATAADSAYTMTTVGDAALVGATATDSEG